MKETNIIVQKRMRDQKYNCSGKIGSGIRGKKRRHKSEKREGKISAFDAFDSLFPGRKTREKSRESSRRIRQ